MDVPQNNPPSAPPISGLRVSLMPSELQGRPAPSLGRGLLALAVVLVAETIAIGVAYFFFSQMIASRVARHDALQGTITQLEQQIAAQGKETERAAAFNGEVAAAQEALNAHLSWTAFFSFLQAHTMMTVTYVNFAADSDSGTVTLDAVAKSYRDAAEQIVALRQDPSILDVHASSASAKISPTGEVTGIAFTMIIKAKPDLWRPR